jgi:hypothetical protein
LSSWRPWLLTNGDTQALKEFIEDMESNTSSEGGDEDFPDTEDGHGDEEERVETVERAERLARDAEALRGFIEDLESVSSDGEASEASEFDADTIGPGTASSPPPVAPESLGGRTAPAGEMAEAAARLQSGVSMRASREASTPLWCRHGISGG